VPHPRRLLSSELVKFTGQIQLEVEESLRIGGKLQEKWPGVASACSDLSSVATCVKAKWKQIYVSRTIGELGLKNLQLTTIME
jgi:hypothetical protein